MSKYITPEIQNEIDTIMDWFDFEKVHTVMTALDWKWAQTGNEVPLPGEIRQFARKLIWDCISGMLHNQKSEYTVQCGGFSVRTYKELYEEKIYIELAFVVTSWDNFE